METLESRRLLAVDLGTPEPYSFDIGASEASNRIRILVEEGSLVVIDDELDSQIESVPLECITEIQIIGSSEADELIVDTSGGFFGVPVDFAGGGPTEMPGDVLTIEGGAADRIAKTFNDASSGSAELTSEESTQSITYRELEPVNLLVPSPVLSFSFLGGAETIRLSDTAAPADGLMEIDSTLGEFTVFAAPTTTLEIDAGTGNDSIEVVSFDTTASFSATIEGGTGNDTFDLDSLPTSITAELLGEEGSDQFLIAGSGISLGAIEGALTITGGSQVASGSVAASVTAITETIMTSVDLGDALELDDSAEATGQTYNVDSTTIARTGIATINYSGIESARLTTTAQADVVNLSDVAAATQFIVSTGGGADELNVTGLGDNSIVTLDTGLDADAVSINATSTGSVLQVITRAGDDDVSVPSWSGASGLDVNSGTESDVVTLEQLGAQAVAAIRTASGADIINVRSTTAGSFLDVFAGSGNDTLNVTSDADGNRMNAAGSLTGNLAGLLGNLRMHGNENDATPSNETSVTVKGNTLSLDLAVGDSLNLGDAGEANAQSYSFNVSTFERAGSPVITHNGFETYSLLTGSEADALSVRTRTQTSLTVATGAGNDSVDVVSTGDSSSLNVATGAGEDSLRIRTSGTGNTLEIDLGENDDDVQVDDLIGSFARIDGAEGADLFDVHAIGPGSALNARGLAGDDLFNLQSSSATSVTHWQGGTGNDIAVLSSDASVTRANPDATTAGDLDGLLGEVCIEGEGQELTPTASNQLTVKSQTISTDLAIGDELRIGDSGSSVGRTYDISATQVIRDTQPTIDHSGIESFEIRTGGFADIVNVASTPADSGTIINTGAGEDEVSIATTGTGSFLEVDTSTDNDLVEVTTTGLMSLTLIRTRAGEDDAVVTDTGALSGLSVNMGSDADVFTLVDSGQQALVEWVGASGEDIANVRGTGAQSATDVRAGTGNDTINVSSSADGTRLDPDAGLNGSLDGLLGELCVHGNENEALPDVSESVTALGNTVTATVSVGDVLNVSDLGSGTSHEYTLDTATFSRVGTPAITFNAIESLIIETGNQLDELTVLRTRAETRSVINTNAGVDSVVIQTTGDNGIVDVDAGTEFDLISIDSTGQESVTLITSRAGEDEILIDGTGTLSGLFVNSGTDSDLVTISGTGDQSVVDVGTAAGEDVINVQATGVSSTTEVNSGTENDAINVSSAANGSLIAPVASAPGTLDQLLGDLLVHGSGDLSNPLIADQVTADGNTFNLQTELGDQLTISDRSLAGGAEYSISTNALTRTGSPAIDFQAIETLFFESGNGNDVVTVIDTRLRTRTTIETNGGEDRVAIEDTGLESVAIVDSGLGNDEISVNGSGNSSLLRLVTRAGDDDVTINSTGDLGGLDVNTGTEVDLVTVIDTGLQTTSLLRLGDQSDVLNVQQVAAASFFEAVGSGGDDVFNLSSDAMGNRSSPVPTLLDDLSGIQSDVLIRGNTNFTNPTTESLDVKGTVVEVTVDTGDLLNISDAGNVAGDQYTLTTTSLQRIGSPEIEFQSMETVQVVTGSGDDDFTLEDTRQQTTTSIDTGAGMDTVLVQTTGNESVTQITMGAGNDVATITTTGDASLLSLNTGTDEDDVIVQSTGTASGLELLTDAGSDVVTIQSNGAESVQSIDLGAETDVLNIRSTSALSALDARLGDGDDFANVTSTANGDRMNRVGDLSGDLAAIAGAICIAGEDDLDGITTDLTVSARRTDADIASVNTVVDLGDSVSISDRGNPAGDDYTLNSNSLARVSQPGGTIIFETIESIGLQTTDFADLIEVESTPSEVLLVIDSGMGEDDVNILATGASSLTRVTTAEDNDVVSVEGTGPQSIVEVFTEVGEDSVSLASLDDESGVLIDTGSDSDVIELLQETSPTARPNGSVIAVQAGSASDTFSVEEVFLNTVVDLMGETENDTFDLTADAADAAGYLGRLNNDPGGVDDGVAATRQLFIDGGANSPGIVSLSQGVSLSGGMNPVPVEPAPVPVEIGDQVNIDASSSALPLDIRYVITGASEGVLVTTTPGDPRQTTGNEVFETIAIEEINIVSGSADDLFTISSNVPYEATSAGQRISFDASGGVDKLEIVGTDDADLISVGPITDADREPIEMENVEFLRIDGDDGNDQIVNRTNAISVIDSLDGDDIVLGGTGPDLLTGGDGVDSLFGRDGNDVLFTDQVLGSNSPTIDDGEIIDGGNEDSIPPGDTCIQFGLDSIRNCEIVGDGGGIKDVLTWLRGVFIDPTDITFVPVSPVLDPFVPAFPTPAETLAVTEPSKLPFSVSSLSAPLSSLLDSNSLKSSKEVKRTSWLTSAIESFGADPMDANRDGIISPRDALFVINSIRQDTTGMDSDARMRLLAGIADVNRDDLVSPRDALMVINYLGRQAEGEGLPQQESDAAWFAAKPIDQVMSGLSRSEDEEESGLF